VRSVQEAAEAGYSYAVDCDLKSFFDTVKFDRLMKLLAQRIADKRVLRLIGAYLRAGVKLPEGTVEATTQGVPQGGPLSPLLANIMLDPLDKELERRGLRFARYADDFLVLLKSLRAAQRVMQSISRFVEGRLQLVVNRQKSRAAPLSQCAFLGFQILRGRIVWTEKALRRFKERIQEITSRSRGVSAFCMLRELKRYAVGWMNYFGLSQAYRVIPELDQWVRRRVRMYYWKQWKRARTRRRRLIRLGIHPAEVYKATRAHRGYWFMAGTSIVQRALDNRWLTERGVPSLKEQWVELHYGQRNRQFCPEAVNLTGTACCGPACQVVWEPGGQSSRRPDSANPSLMYDRPTAILQHSPAQKNRSTRRQHPDRDPCDLKARVGSVCEQTTDFGLAVRRHLNRNSERDADKQQDSRCHTHHDGLHFCHSALVAEQLLSGRLVISI
jgi:hypothetical protein